MKAQHRFRCCAKRIAWLPGIDSQRNRCRRVLPLEVVWYQWRSRKGISFLTAQQARKRRSAIRRRASKRWKNPIHVARRYLRDRQGGAVTYEQIAQKHGVSRAEVCYHIALVERLPPEFVAWLEQRRDAETLRVFTERRLRPITRAGGRREQREMLRELGCMAECELAAWQEERPVTASGTR